MKAVALAAGLGTRLGSITHLRPKCMIEVAGKPLLQHNLEWAAKSGITEVAVNLHHRSEVVISHFRQHGAPLPIHWSYEPSLLGTAGTLGSLAAWLGGERFTVIYADNLIQCDLAAVASVHERESASATIALFAREDVSHSGVAELNGERIIRFIERPAHGETPSRWVSAGLLILEPEAALLAPAKGDIGRDLLPSLIAASHTVAGYRMSAGESLHWIDTPADLERTRAAFSAVAS